MAICEPALKNARSMPEKEFWSSPSTTISSERNCSVRPTERGDASRTEICDRKFAAFHYPQQFDSNCTGRADDCYMIAFTHRERILSSAS